jgi:hypothetical protein
VEIHRHAFLNSALERRCVVSSTPRPLYAQGKSPWYPMDRRLGGPQCRSGHGGEEKNSHSLSWLEPLIIQPLAQRCTTELSRLIKINECDVVPMPDHSFLFRQICPDHRAPSPGTHWAVSFVTWRLSFWSWDLGICWPHSHNKLTTTAMVQTWNPINKKYVTLQAVLN